MTKITLSNHQIARAGQSYVFIGSRFRVNMKNNFLVASKCPARNRAVNRYVPIFLVMNKPSGEIYEC